jgi:phosphoglycolate phosphatase (TIGR01487 family)
VLKAVLTDVDGTLTDAGRRISTRAIETIRELTDRGVTVVLASGNTACFMDALCRMIGTEGTLIAENGGVYRIGYTGDLRIRGDQEECWEAFALLNTHFAGKGIALELFSPTYRYADVAFGRTVSSAAVRDLLDESRIQVIDTGFAIHLQSPGINKGTALAELAGELGMQPSDFLAVGDSVNDVEMFRLAGVSAAVANAHPDAKAHATYVSEKEYGLGFVEAVENYSSYFLER